MAINEFLHPIITQVIIHLEYYNINILHSLQFLYNLNIPSYMIFVHTQWHAINPLFIIHITVEGSKLT